MLLLPASLQREPYHHAPLELVSSRKAAKSSGQLRSCWRYSCPSRAFVGGALGRWGQLAKRLCALGQWTRWLQRTCIYCVSYSRVCHSLPTQAPYYTPTSRRISSLICS